MKKKKVAVLFDLDGTLRNSMQLGHEAVCHVFREHNLAPPSYADLCKYLRAPFESFYHMFGVKSTRAEIDVSFRKHARKHNTAPGLFPDSKRVLQTMYEKGIVLGIVSARENDLVSKFCEEFEILQYLSYVLGGSECKIAGIKKFLTEFNLEGDRVLYVGDFCCDIYDALNAGVGAVGITRGCPTREVLLEAGADHCIDHLDELFPLLGI